MENPPARNVSGDRYADEHNIPYETGSMTCKRVVWDYRIYYPNGEPEDMYGTIGDIAVSRNPNDGNKNNNNTSLWYRGYTKWLRAEFGVNPTTGHPDQKHPLLKSRYRLDLVTKRWRNANVYYRRNVRNRNGDVKTEPGDGGIAFIKKEAKDVEDPKDKESSSSAAGTNGKAEVQMGPVRIDLTEGHSVVTQGDGERQAVFIDLLLKENEPPRKIALVLPRPSSSQGSDPPAPANIDVVAREPTPAPSVTSSSAPGASHPPPGIPSTSTISTNSTTQPMGQGIEAISAPGSSTSQESDPKSFALDDLDDLDFKYPELGLDLNMLPPLPSEWARPVLPTFSLDQSVLPHNPRQQESNFLDPDATIVHTTPMSDDGFGSIKHRDVEAPVDGPGAPSSSKSHSAAEPQASGSVESLLQRLLLESAKDRRDMLELIRMMSQRLERLEEKQLQLEGLRYSISPSVASPGDGKLIMPTTTPAIPTTTTTIAASAPPSYDGPSLPLPKRYLKQSRAQIYGEGTGDRNVGATSAMEVTNTKKRKACTEPEEILEDEVDSVVKKSRFSTQVDAAM